MKKYRKLFIFVMGSIFIAGCSKQEEATNIPSASTIPEKHITIENEYKKYAGTKEIAGSYYIIENNILKGYGNNQCGQLGLGRLEDIDIYHEEAVSIDNNIVHVDMLSSEFVIYLNNKNELFGIGNNRSGQLGQSIEGKDRMSTECFIMEPVSIADDVKYAVAGLNFMLILKQDGSLYGLGDNANGQLGDGTAKSVRGERYSAYSTPFSNVPVFIMDRVSFIACDLYTAAAIKEDGTLFIWGDNSFGEIGNGEKGNEMPTVSNYVVSEPFRVMHEVKDIWFEDFTVYATDFSGERYTWGKNSTATPHKIIN